jgi:hypothetical protein
MLSSNLSHNLPLLLVNKWNPCELEIHSIVDGARSAILPSEASPQRSDCATMSRYFTTNIFPSICSRMKALRDCYFMLVCAYRI